MGTRFELVLVSGPADLRTAGEAGVHEIEEWHRRLSRFAPDSLLSHINRTAATSPVRLDGDTFALFADAQRVRRESGGAFDITVAPLMARHGFAPSAVRGEVGTDGSAITLDETTWTIRFTRSGLSLDLGGIGKGHALDRAAAVLRGLGVTSALLHGGTSSVSAIGSSPDGRGWHIRLGSSAAGPVVTLRDQALAVSDAGSQRGEGEPAHLVDPRSARPAPRGRAVAVIGASARLADAWATAVAVLGRVPGNLPSGYRAVHLAGATS